MFSAHAQYKIFVLSNPPFTNPAYAPASNLEIIDGVLSQQILTSLAEALGRICTIRDDIHVLAHSFSIHTTSDHHL